MKSVVLTKDYVAPKHFCHYDPVKDLSPVSQADVLDLGSALTNGMIPADLVVPDTEYDGQDDPRGIYGRPVNEFEAIHMAESIKMTAESVGKATDSN